MRPADLLTDLIDLVLARACLDCDRLGRVLCSPCLEHRRGRLRTQVLPSGLPVTAALDYVPDGRELVVAYKEHGTRALAPMLGALLADAVCAALDSAAPDPGVGTRALLVPVPAHRRAHRGFDALGGIVRHAVPALRERGRRVEVARPVRGGGAYRPLKELGRDDRRRAVAGAFVLHPQVAARVAAAQCPLIVVDDVVTTGATVERIATLLSASGCPVTAVASVALVSPGTPAPNRARARPTLPR